MESELAKEIKIFRKRFKKENGRDPTKKDMAKEPGMLAKYESWLSLKSGQSSSTSFKTASQNTQRERTDKKSTNQTQRETEPDHQYVMAPPPLTPKKKVQKTNFDIGTLQSFKTPTRSSKEHKEEMKESIENSGGSVRSLMEVPVTPSRRSPSKKYFSQSPSTPSSSSSHFDDGTSPSKLRTLIDSFAATRSRGITTPTKSNHQASRASNGTIEDERLASQLHSSYHTKDAKMSDRQNNSTYTPRTKARKRLRGEIVITPGKTPQKSILGEGQQQITPTKVQRPPKRQRGMGTLQDFGLVSKAGPQAKMKIKDTVVSTVHLAQSLSDGDDEDDDDDDLIGPSPSTHKIINVQVQSSFRPLFGNASELSTDLDEYDKFDQRDEGEHDTDMKELQSSQTDLTHSGHGTETALTTPAEENLGAEMDSDEEELMYLREYSRRFTLSDNHNRQSNRQFGNKENLDDVIDEEEDGMLVNIGLPTSKRHSTHVQQAGNESDEENLFENLSIHSPQGKRARQYQRRANAKSVRNLLEADQIFDKAASLATKEPNEESENEETRANDERSTFSKQSKNTKETLSQTFSSKTKTARMMRGKVTKAQHRSLAATEAMEEVEKELIGQNDAKACYLAPSVSRKSGKKSMIIRRGREDESEDEEEEGEGEDFTSDNEPGYDEDYDGPRKRSDTRRAQEDDEWASDVDSAEYGLGDGYMDEMDVM